MSRVDALRKLLRLGERSLPEIMQIMGGDRDQAEAALVMLVSAKQVSRIGAERAQRSVRYRLIGGVHG